MNTSLKECVQAKSNETRWRVGGTTREEKGGCNGKRGAEGDGRGGAGRGGNGAPSPSEGALTQRWSRPWHGDTSTARRGLSAAAGGPEAGRAGLKVGVTTGPVRPIRLAAERCGGSTRNRDKGEKRTSRDTQLCKPANFGVRPDSSGEHLGERVGSGQ